METFEFNICREYLISWCKPLSYIYFSNIIYLTYSNGHPIVFYAQRLKKYNNENIDIIKYVLLFPGRTLCFYDGF